MTQRQTAALTGLAPHYKVRVVLPGVVLHLAAWEQPRFDTVQVSSAISETGWHAEWIEDPRFGDTVGFIDWSQVVALTWRWTGEVADDPEEER
jgi:hypothetical protein